MKLVVNRSGQLCHALTALASQELGIPTANLDPAALQGQLAEAVTGIVFGWASLGTSMAVYATAISIGYNPFFGNRVRVECLWHRLCVAFENLGHHQCFSLQRRRSFSLELH